MAENDENLVDGQDAGDALQGLDFNVNDEYKPDPLIPKGTYHAVVTAVKFNPAQYSIVWDVCLHDNGGAMNDGMTPIDGAHAFFRNWLPKPGDEEIMTKSGRNTKRQSKINMLKDFQDKVGIDMSTPEIIGTSLLEHSYDGTEVDVDIDVEEYEGRFRNVIQAMRKSSAF